ncbi:TIM barrel protein [Gloeocapsa sp. BRSZ]
MQRIRVANAPCSWGDLGVQGLEGESIGYQQMLDELVETGYIGTDLGDWGYMPTDPEKLRTELERRNLTIVSGYVPVALKNPESHRQAEAQALKIARLLSTVAQTSTTQTVRPFMVVMDEIGAVPVRTQNAGRVEPNMELSEREWRTCIEGAEQIARLIWDETGMRTTFHHHCASYLETPKEISCFLEQTDPNLIGLTLDTGHYAYGAATDDGQCVLEAFERFGDRIWHVHFKDCDLKIARAARNQGWDYFEAVRRGLFCELGQGGVDFPGVVSWLREHDYNGCIVVEQDVLPGMGTPKESAQRNREYLKQLGL